MTTTVTPIPQDKPQLSVILNVKNAARALEFYQQALGARVISSFVMPNGIVGHAELRVGTAVFAVSDEFPEHGALSPETVGGSPAMVHLYVENADETVARAVAAGAKAHEPVSDQFYGDRGGKITDPFGHRWWIATQIEVVSIEEQAARARKLFGTA